MSKSREPRRPEHVEIEIDGTRYSGTYTVDGGGVHVSSNFGSKSAHNGSISHIELAKLLLLELVPIEKH